MTASAVFPFLARHAGRFHFRRPRGTRDQLLAKLTLPVEPVEVDGMTIYLRDVSYGTQLKIADMRLAEQERFRRP